MDVFFSSEHMQCILKINRMMSFCNLFMERPSYIFYGTRCTAVQVGL